MLAELCQICFLYMHAMSAHVRVCVCAVVSCNLCYLLSVTCSYCQSVFLFSRLPKWCSGGKRSLLAGFGRGPASSAVARWLCQPEVPSWDGVDQLDDRSWSSASFLTRQPSNTLHCTIKKEKHMRQYFIWYSCKFTVTQKNTPDMMVLEVAISLRTFTLRVPTDLAPSEEDPLPIQVLPASQDDLLESGIWGVSSGLHL